MKHVTSSQKEVGLSSQKMINPISIVVFVLIIGVITIVLYLDELMAYEHIIPWSVSISALVLALLVAAAIKIADQWEKAVILRMGKFIGLKGPGLFFIIPVLDRVDKYIDQRVRVTDFNAEKTLTKDTVPVDVDAVVYWTVWDVEKAALEVRRYIEAVTYMAQTGLRDIIGRHELADLLQNREKIAEALQHTLDEHTNPWGITCQNVGIKDIVIPADLADAMSKQAQAERERHQQIVRNASQANIA